MGTAQSALMSAPASLTKAFEAARVQAISQLQAAHAARDKELETLQQIWSKRITLREQIDTQRSALHVHSHGSCFTLLHYGN